MDLVPLACEDAKSHVLDFFLIGILEHVISRMKEGKDFKYFLSLDIQCAVFLPFLFGIQFLNCEIENIKYIFSKFSLIEG